MNRLSIMLIVLVLLARGAIYMYDHNKTKIDKLMLQPEQAPPADSVYVITDQPIPTESEADIKNISPFTITFLLTGNDEIYYYGGEINNNLNSISYNALAIFVKAYKDAVNKDDLMFIIKHDNNATNKNIVDALDAMVKSGVPAGHYVQRQMTKEESDGIRSLKARNNG